MASSCSHWWWQGPVFFTISAILAFVAISTAFHSNPNDNSVPSTKHITQELTYNASQALRKSGFNIMATLVQISPEQFFSTFSSSSNSSSTFFAIQDSAISNTSLPPLLMRQLIQYHTVPSSKLSMNVLLKNPKGICFPTLLHQKKIVITKKNVKERSLEINHIPISHPDVFLGGPISIHGVAGPFALLNPREIDQGLGSFQSPLCDSNLSLVSDVSQSKNVIPWGQIIRLMSSKGFVSFAIGVHSVLDGILQDCSNLTSVTVFAPPDLSFVTSPSPLLAKVVRFHILPQRFTLTHLASLPEKASLKTLVPDQYLQITAHVNSTKRFAIDGVEIMAPDACTSKKFIVHGISKAFEIPGLPKSS